MLINQIRTRANIQYARLSLNKRNLIKYCCFTEFTEAVKKSQMMGSGTGRQGEVEIGSM